jgi:hypothetical protein
MLEELITIEQLERVQRLVQAGQTDLASRHLQVMIEGRQERVDQFEADLFDNLPV